MPAYGSGWSTLCVEDGPAAVARSLALSTGRTIGSVLADGIALVGQSLGFDPAALSKPNTPALGAVSQPDIGRMFIASPLANVEP